MLTLYTEMHSETGIGN